MTEIFKTDNPKIIPYIVEKMHNIKDLDVREATEGLLIQLASSPDNTAIFVVFEEEELKSFIYGWYNELEKIGWIQQAWADASLQREYKQEIFERFGDWAKEFGAKSIQAQTTRINMKAWKRLYGLTEHAVVMIKEL